MSEKNKINNKKEISQEEQQELIFRLSMFEQQIQQLQEQINAVEKGIEELKSLDNGLDEIKQGVGKEILAPLGRGVFVKTKLESEKLTVDIGGKNFVEKSVPDTKSIIEDQITKLNSVKKDLTRNLEQMSQEMSEMVSGLS